jgi:hypothetical protein
MSASRRARIAAIAWCVCLGFAAAQEDPHADCTVMGWVPREILERTVALRSGTGNAHEPVTTSSSEAGRPRVRRA